jgi:hypothetical protein
MIRRHISRLVIVHARTLLVMLSVAATVLVTPKGSHWG